MSTSDDDDDWADEFAGDAPTTIDLLPDEISQIEREETTPAVRAEKLPGWDVGRRAGIYEMIADVRAVFTEARNTPEFIDALTVLLARRANVPWPPQD